MLKNVVKASVSTLVLASIGLTQLPSAFASTTNTTTTQVDGQTAQVSVTTDNSSERVVQVTIDGQTSTATLNKSTAQLTVTGDSSGTKNYNMSSLSKSASSGVGTISPMSMTATVSDSWWGDYASDQVSGSSQYWHVALGGGGSWTGYQTSKNASGLSTYMSAVTNTSNAELATYAAGAGFAASGAIAIVTSETVVASVIAAVVALGFGTVCADQAAQAWNDHQVDKVDYANIPGV
ncbi:geobacillin-26 family protein (plasmid) [Alicyclobacillus fastidiosus]|uniref:Geobacillin-26 family protein n=1 Tax=Alicyclobacillus fastidiosus TaxID=392011 RepID=A0ABY6ZPF3_9BACL|nr:geobacillin-26 family protein [Alicyclobacillus fastidiosus]WAH44865.1 geobacillin-26 family protein [Alicyclobacillus fastidiosus]GMA65621.1 hypothetical protein GCM10025859_60610 [Alicyclobacillus fastidiosus]GMA65838.1 hypothetical protein GCM10025859_62780 [Alicyclobacillus fastidiosus]